MLDAIHPKINPQKMSPHDRMGDACNTSSRIADMLPMHNAHIHRTCERTVVLSAYESSTLLLPDELDVRSKTADIVSKLLWYDCL